MPSFPPERPTERENHVGSDAAFAAIGVDLAWRPSRNPSAVAVLRGTSEGAELTYLCTDHRSKEGVRNPIPTNADACGRRACVR